LRQRAERIAGQLAHATGIGSAAAIETRSPLFTALPEGCPSYGVALTTTEGDIQSLDRRLRSAPLPILGRVEGDRLILDLRTVPPRHDITLVEILTGSSTSDEAAQYQATPTNSEISS
jgi:L-seryl-tRNA(Ser) seleniumtransferase